MRSLNNKFTFFCLFWLFIFSFAGLSSIQARGLFNGSSSLLDWKEWQPSRAEIRLDVVRQQSSWLQTRLQGICYDIFEKDKPYFLYLGLGFCYQGFIAEPVVGWSFRDNEWVGGMRLYGQWPGFRFYQNLEIQPIKTQSFYYIAQMEWRFLPFLEGGLEAEGWGDVTDHIYSHGFGTNFILNFQGLKRLGLNESKLNFETAIQYRELGDKWKPQLVVRFIFQPKMKDHTPSRRPEKRRKH